MTDRVRLPAGEREQEEFVMRRVRELRGGCSYNKMNNRHELLEKFGLQKKSFDQLCMTINRLVEAGRLERRVKVTRLTQNFGMHCNPASRTVTLTVASPARSDADSRHSSYFVAS